MLYFEVEEGRLSGHIEATPVARDGNWCGGGEVLEDTEDVLLWYRVVEYYEDGTTKDIVYYRVDDNADEVLDMIEREHPAGEWQNNDW